MIWEKLFYLTETCVTFVLIQGFFVSLTKNQVNNQTMKKIPLFFEIKHFGNALCLKSFRVKKPRTNSCVLSTLDTLPTDSICFNVFHKKSLKTFHPTFIISEHLFFKALKWRYQFNGPKGNFFQGLQTFSFSQTYDFMETVHT